MFCCWEELLKILPAWIRDSVNSLGKDELQELRLRLGQPGELIFRGRRQWLRQTVRQEDLSFCINAVSSFSPWTMGTASDGYLTAPGGHRVGICGEVTMKNGQACGISRPESLCIRVARDFPGIGEQAGILSGSILILGAPGWGKTTLLRDLIRFRSRKETVSVVDERGELFPPGFDRGLQTDVLTGCPKARGLLQLLRTMGPQTIAVDEITAPDDCRALGQASFCGVHLLATAHASTFNEFRGRRIYEDLLKDKIFDYVLTLQENQTYQVERMEL